MKIRKKITYTFTALFAVLILTLCLMVYFISNATHEQLFFDRLNERLKITEQFFLESEAFSTEVREKVRGNFLKTLPDELEFVDTLNHFNPPAHLNSKLPPDFVSNLVIERELEWSHDKMQGIARIYEVNETEFVVIVVATDEDGNAYIASLKIILLLSFLLMVILTYILSNYFSINVLKPIAEKIKKANMISATNLDTRLTVFNQNDELGMLALSFNNLLDRLQTAFELEKNFVRYASHELKNPLAVILGEAEVSLLKSRSVNEYVDTIEKIKSKAEKLNKLVDHFLQLSKLESILLKGKKVLLDEVLIDIIFAISQEYDQVEIVFNIGENGETDDFEIEADPQLMHNALYNIIDNACKFSINGGEVVVDLVKSARDHKTRISIKDQGIGIEAAQLQHIFKPLYRGANSKAIEGTGIGLALVKRIIDLHGGEIQVYSNPTEGTEFVILI